MPMIFPSASVTIKFFAMGISPFVTDYSIFFTACVFCYGFLPLPFAFAVNVFLLWVSPPPRFYYNTVKTVCQQKNALLPGVFEIVLFLQRIRPEHGA
ncbi:MAG: hypothetical protein IKO92_04275, partial [Clostridia bacterium]|nr:hypothetical protein [Clostridia bacterium]